MLKTRQPSCQQSWWATVVRGNEYSTITEEKKKKAFFSAIPRELGIQIGGKTGII